MIEKRYENDYEITGKRLFFNFSKLILKNSLKRNV